MKWNACFAYTAPKALVSGILQELHRGHFYGGGPNAKFVEPWSNVK